MNQLTQLAAGCVAALMRHMHAPMNLFAYTLSRVISSSFVHQARSFFPLFMPVSLCRGEKREKKSRERERVADSRGFFSDARLLCDFPGDAPLSTHRDIKKLFSCQRTRNARAQSIFALCRRLFYCSTRGCGDFCTADIHSLPYISAAGLNETAVASQRVMACPTSHIMLFDRLQKLSCRLENFFHTKFFVLLVPEVVLTQ